MKYAKSILMGTGSVVLAGLILTLVAPKAVHAVVATAVQVMNTSATPVPNRDVDEPARTAYTTTCQGSPECSTFVPSGKIFVIETISAEGGGNTMSITYSSGGALSQILFPLTPVSGSDYVGTVSVRLYVDPSSGINCQANLHEFCTLSGHLVSTP
jgi:hypothetical protein